MKVALLLNFKQVRRRTKYICFVKNRGEILCSGEEKMCVCVCEREREREYRHKVYKHREYTSRCILTKEKDLTYYKVGGGCFI